MLALPLQQGEQIPYTENPAVSISPSRYINTIILSAEWPRCSREASRQPFDRKT
jgi:hypothetical protein